MSSNAPSETPKSGSWTDKERVQLLIQIILQHPPARIDMAKIKLPGRTPKAMQHVFGRIKSEAQACLDNNSSTVSRESRPASKKRTHMDDEETAAVNKRRA
ncbi:hypothetical protein D7B24_005265 [Verticillium nonalfalfae]|uniref:Uncharacterized protein n=1 Tax=Verticillium nonalfalfae TaxID=1051616 RepID=A0A3M9YG63_9PEZI|nr:uncharacterized protein D7B24_005265 [Verticillium nonalfalfae]RNJ58120.1 hypothetical protein D7B24_005265 [Verticillium nonalfalfae]